MDGANRQCNGCGGAIRGWITYHKENDDPVAVAYCYLCTDQDPAIFYERPREAWTLRIRCQSFEQNGQRCKECTQSCRVPGNGPPLCVRHWGWQSQRRVWYCPRHAAENLSEPRRAPAQCDCGRLKPVAEDEASES